MMMDEIHFFDKETERNIGYPTNIIAKKNVASGINIKEENNKVAAFIMEEAFHEAIIIYSIIGYTFQK